jgi:hypothetical protein
LDYIRKTATFGVLRTYSDPDPIGAYLEWLVCAVAQRDYIVWSLLKRGKINFKAPYVRISLFWMNNLVIVTCQEWRHCMSCLYTIHAMYVCVV